MTGNLTIHWDEGWALHLSRVRARGFKSLLCTDISFRPAVTVVVGENNAGKSNLVDALRLLTDPLDGRRTRWWEGDDVHPWREEHADLTAVYAGLEPAEAGTHIQALVSAEEEPSLGDGHRARYSVRFARPAADARPKRPVWAAGRLMDDPEPEARRMIRHVYLPPMRNAQQELASSSGNRLRLILAAELGGTEAIKAFEEEQAGLFQDLQQHEKVKAARDRINVPLEHLTAGAHPQHMGLSFADPTLVSIARALRTRMGDEDLDFEDIARSGLGYTNLLYISTVLAELDAARDADLTLFLVEEPEAHLHPQLQYLLLEHLKNKASESQAARVLNDGSPLGHIQVVITTHSPVLASATTVEDLVVLKRCRTSAPQPEIATATAETPAVTQSHEDGGAKHRESPTAGYAFTTAAVPVAQIPFSKHEPAKLDRFLDITKSSMLFANRVILVEGMAEALLMPAFARLVLAKIPGLDARRRAQAVFSGSCIVMVDGVDFTPYMRALLADVDGNRVADRVVLITDEDPQKKDSNDTELLGRPPNGPDNDEVAYNRASSLRGKLIRWGVPESTFHIAESRPTLEPVLMQPSNQEILSQVFRDLRPKSQHHWQPIEEASSPSDQSIAFGQLFTSQKVRLPKGDYAYRLADQLNRDPGGFEVPEHLAAAIRWISGVDGPSA